MKEHKLKTWTDSFQPIWDGRKSFDLRKNDRDFQIGDTLILREWNPETGYTGRGIAAEVTWILQTGYGLPEGYCIMSLVTLSPPGRFHQRLSDAGEPVANTKQERIDLDEFDWNDYKQELFLPGKND